MDKPLITHEVVQTSCVCAYRDWQVELAWNEVISLKYRPLVSLTDNVDQHNNYINF